MAVQSLYYANDWLRQALLYRKKTASWLARELCIERATVSAWVTAHQGKVIDRLRWVAICKVLDIPLEFQGFDGGSTMLVGIPPDLHPKKIAAGSRVGRKPRTKERDQKTREELRAERLQKEKELRENVKRLRQEERIAWEESRRLARKEKEFAKKEAARQRKEAAALAEREMERGAIRLSCSCGQQKGYHVSAQAEIKEWISSHLLRGHHPKIDE